MAENIYWFLTHPIFWGIFALIISALQIAGIIKMITARILLFVAWLIATISIASFLNNAPFQHRVIAGALIGVPFGLILLYLERWITKTVNKRETEQNAKSNSVIEVEIPKEKRKQQALIISLNGLIAKAESFLKDYEDQKETVKYAGAESNSYVSYRTKADEWQRDLELFIISNFPKYFLDTLKFDQDLTPGGIRLKINTLKKVIEDLKS